MANTTLRMVSTLFYRCFPLFNFPPSKTVFLVELWQELCSKLQYRFMHKALTHTVAPQSRVPRFTILLPTAVTIATPANSFFKLLQYFSPTVWAGCKATYSENLLWANGHTDNLVIGNNLRLMHTFQGQRSAFYMTFQFYIPRADFQRKHYREQKEEIFKTLC